MDQSGYFCKPFLTVAPDSASITTSETQQLTATFTDTDGSEQDVSSSATWTSDDDTIASVDTSGLVTGESAGSAVVTADHNGFTDTSDITVS